MKNFKRFLLHFLTSVTVGATALGLASCSSCSSCGGHKHTSGTGTCTEQAVCEECGEKYGPVGHQYPKFPDDLKYENYVCEVCDFEYYSQNLEYEEVSGGYAVKNVLPAKEGDDFPYDIIVSEAVLYDEYGYLAGTKTYLQQVKQERETAAREENRSYSATIKSVVAIANYAFSWSNEKINIKNVILPNSITSIGDAAFYKCDSLSNILIPNTVKSIGEKVFYECGSLGEMVVIKKDENANPVKNEKEEYEKVKKSVPIHIPNNVTTIGKEAFYLCGKLSSVTGCNSVVSLGDSAFGQCVALSSLAFGDSLEYIGNKAFYNCKLLKKVTIKSKALTSVGSKAFKKCKKGIVFVVPKDKKGAYSKLFKGKY